MKFLCDQMLVRLGRWLRAAGHDTRIAEGTLSDEEINAIALKEQRLLITRDRHFIAFDPEKKYVVWLEGNTVDECVKELSQSVAINWLYAPFTRCLLCNGPLVEASEEDLKEVPRDSKEQKKCPGCHKVYWLGSHTDRMLDRLKEFARIGE